MFTPWAAEPLRPAHLKQVVSTGLLGSEPRFELSQIARIILHSRPYYILGSPESSKYPADVEFNTEIKDQPWAREVQLTDPDGNRLRIGERKPLCTRSKARHSVVMERETAHNNAMNAEPPTARLQVEDQR